MPITINGSGTVTGISVGGLPDGIVDTDMIAAAAVTAPKKGTGSILQIVSFSKTDTSSVSVAANTNTDGLGLTASITPSSSSNKILIFGMFNISIVDQQHGIGAVIFKAGSVLSGAVADAAGSRRQLTALGEAASSSNYSDTINVQYLDTAGSTSSIAYKIEAHNPSSITRVAYLNRAVTDTDNQYHRRAISTITLMEVAV